MPLRFRPLGVTTRACRCRWGRCCQPRWCCHPLVPEPGDTTVHRRHSASVAWRPGAAGTARRASSPHRGPCDDKRPRPAHVAGLMSPARCEVSRTQWWKYRATRWSDGRWRRLGDLEESQRGTGSSVPPSGRHPDLCRGAWSSRGWTYIRDGSERFACSRAAQRRGDRPAPAVCPSTSHTSWSSRPGQRTYRRRRALLWSPGMWWCPAPCRADHDTVRRQDSRRWCGRTGPPGIVRASPGTSRQRPASARRSWRRCRTGDTRCRLWPCWRSRCAGGTGRSSRRSCSPAACPGEWPSPGSCSRGSRRSARRQMLDAEVTEPAGREVPEEAQTSGPMADGGWS